MLSVFLKLLEDPLREGISTLFLHGICACAGVVDHDGLNVVVGGIIRVKHSIGDIRYVILLTLVSPLNSLHMIQDSPLHSSRQ